MSQHEKTAWWSLAAAILIWLFLLMRFTEDWQVSDLSPSLVLSTYIQTIVLWIIATAAPAAVSARRSAEPERDERDRAIAALGDRWEGWVVVIAVNVLVVHLLMDAYYVDRTPSVPRLDLGSMPALVFALLTVLFLADAVKQAVIVWQYRR